MTSLNVRDVGSSLGGDSAVLQYDCIHSPIQHLTRISVFYSSLSRFRVTSELQFSSGDSFLIRIPMSICPCMCVYQLQHTCSMFDAPMIWCNESAVTQLGSQLLRMISERSKMLYCSGENLLKFDQSLYRFQSDFAAANVCRRSPVF